MVDMTRTGLEQLREAKERQGKHNSIRNASFHSGKMKKRMC